jgi:transcriptional regulator with XRE-family HTH domain
MALVELFWDRVAQEVLAKPKGRKGVQKALTRNKNTYSKWLSPKFSGVRPNIRISDLEDLATALDVPPAQLLTANGRTPAREPQPLQLELPFEVGSKAVRIEVECTDKGLVLRPTAS